MDVIFFLKDRTAFIRQLYSTTSAPYSAPYIERMQKIEDEEEPFVPLYGGGEDGGDQAFLGEFTEAAESIDTLRLMFLSMLASILQAYLKTWIKLSRIPFDKNTTLCKTIPGKKGWFWGYSNHFNHHFKIDFESAPIDLKIIEEIILARNNIEHQFSIVGRPKYGTGDWIKLRSTSYIDEFSVRILPSTGFSTFLPPSVHVTEEQLLEAISTVEVFAEWFNNEIEPKFYRPKKV